MFVEGGAFIPQVIGADDRGVAAGIAAAEPATLHHRHVPYAMFAREIVCRGQSMATGADDHDVIRRLWLRRAPLRGPGNAANGMTHQVEDRKAQRSLPPRIL